MTGLPASYSNTNVAAYLPTYTGNVSANYFIGDGSLLTGLPASYSNANVAAYLPTYTGNLTAGNANISGNLIAGNLTTSGSGGNLSGANYVISNYFSGNGSLLTSITGANVSGYVPLSTTANVAGTVTTAAQPNITSTGTLLGLSVTGNLNITGNINATGNLNYSNVTDLVVGDPLIYLGANNTGNLYDLGIVASYNDGTYYHTGIARDATDGTWKLFDTVVAEPTTTIDFANGTYAPFRTGSFTSTGNITAVNASLGNLATSNYFSGNGSLLTSITGANVSGYVSLSTAANTAATVTTASQPNITSVGNLTSLTVTGNVSANYFIGDGSQLTGISGTYSNTNVAAYLPTYTGNISANYFIGNGSTLTEITGANVTGYVPLSTSANTAATVTTAAQPNITSVGTLTGLTSNGVLDFTNTSNLAIGNISNLYIPGGSANYVIITNGSGVLSWAAQSGGGGNTSANVFANIISDTFTGNGVATTYTLSVTPTSINDTTINYNGTMLLRDAYSLSGANVTFDSAPANGSYIEVTTLATANASQYATTGKAIAMAIVFGF